MSADSFDAFDYQPASEHISEALRKHYWAVAIGLQKVDGLSVSPYTRTVAASYISGKTTLSAAGDLIRNYHVNGNDTVHIEADLVSQRIVELLVKGTFFLSPEILSCIHGYIFQDLEVATYHPGTFKTERMVKQEAILNGDSVLYADPSAYHMSLQGAFAVEAAQCYTTFTDEELKNFCHTVAFLWQVHPFYEGNTRTVAVFSELYLNHLGFQVTNEPFEKHAQYFRDALVRAMYRNAAANIFPNDTFLIAFYKNVLGFAQTSFNREELVCPVLFENPSLLRNVDPAEALQGANTPF